MANKNVMTVSQAPHAVNIVYQQAALKTLDKFLVHAGWGQNYQMPVNQGDTMKWSRWSALLAQTTPLDEVEDPAPILATRTDLSVQMKEYGAWMKLSRWLQMTGLGSTQATLSERLSKQMALSMDTLVRDVLAGCASQTTCSNGSGTETLPNKTDIDSIVQTLYAAGAEPITSRMGAATGQGTSPLSQAFIGIMHTSGMNRIRSVAGFIEVKNYANPGDAYPYEIGATGMVRWVLTNNGYTSGGYYYAPILGQDAYGEVRMRAGSNPLIYKSPEQSPSPLNRYGTLGWDTPFATRVLNDLLMHVMLHTV
jgi:N4-gp56 family major capsid protein